VTWYIKSPLYSYTNGAKIGKYTDALELIAKLFCSASVCVKGKFLQFDELSLTHTQKQKTENAKTKQK